MPASNSTFDEGSLLNPGTQHSSITAAWPAEPPAIDCEEWEQLLVAARGGGHLTHSCSELFQLYAPLCSDTTRESFVVAHLAQSLDGKIATESGVSRWLSGDEDLLHTHRMRALFDAVVVGVNTVLLDDPQLTVRRCKGQNPVRVIIDPDRRLDGSQRAFLEPTAKTVLVTANDKTGSDTHLGHAQIIGIERQGSGLDPLAILQALTQLGLKRIFVEGGGTTVSRFLQAGVLDRLQLTIAPVILGSGRAAVKLPTISDLNNSLRPHTRQFRLGADTMIECIFRH